MCRAALTTSAIVFVLLAAECVKSTQIQDSDACSTCKESGYIRLDSGSDCCSTCKESGHIKLDKWSDANDEVSFLQRFLDLPPRPEEPTYTREESMPMIPTVMDRDRGSQMDPTSIYLEDAGTDRYEDPEDDSEVPSPGIAVQYGTLQQPAPAMQLATQPVVQPMRQAFELVQPITPMQVVQPMKYPRQTRTGGLLRRLLHSQEVLMQHQRHESFIERSLANETERNSDLSQTNKKLETKLSNKEKQIAQLQTELSNDDKQTAELLTKLSNEDKQTAQLQAKLTAAQSRLHQFRTKSQILEETLHNQKFESESAAKEISDLRSWVSETEPKLKALLAKATALEKEDHELTERQQEVADKARRREAVALMKQLKQEAQVEIKKAWQAGKAQANEELFQHGILAGLSLESAAIAPKNDDDGS